MRGSRGGGQGGPPPSPQNIAPPNSEARAKRALPPPGAKRALPPPPLQNPGSAYAHYPIGVKRVHVNGPNVAGTVFQTFLNYKQRSYIQFITNEQVKLISFIREGVDFTLGIRHAPLSPGSELDGFVKWRFSLTFHFPVNSCSGEFYQCVSRVPDVLIRRPIN